MKAFRSLMAVVLWTLGCSSSAAAETISGRPDIKNGRTLELGGVRMQLLGIDAPDPLQHCRKPTGEYSRCGYESAMFLHDLVKDRDVVCRIVSAGTPVLLARCSVNGKDIAQQVFRSGHGIISGSAKTAGYVEAEAEAKLNKRGLWAGTFVNPEEWRVAFKKNVPIVSIIHGKPATSQRPEK